MATAAVAVLVMAGAVVAFAVVDGPSPPEAGFYPNRVFPVGPISGRTSHQILELDHVASTLAGRRATVNCWAQGDWTRLMKAAGSQYQDTDFEGLTFPQTESIELSPFVCQVLGQVLARSAQQPLFTAYAVTILAHESAHASGIRPENLAECRAIKTEPRAAQLLGIPKTVALRLQHIYRGTAYPQDLPRYRTPPCKAGLPGAVVPDTLGTAADLRPMRRTAAAVARSLPGWRDIGGEVGELDPCAPIRNRTQEVARFDDTLQLSPEYARFSNAIVRTPRAFATVSARYRYVPHCIRRSHGAATVGLRRLPAAITRLSRQVHGLRQLYRAQGITVDVDTIYVLDRARREMPTLIFTAPAGLLSPSTERRATAAMLQALRSGGS